MPCLEVFRSVWSGEKARSRPGLALARIGCIALDLAENGLLWGRCSKRFAPRVREDLGSDKRGFSG